MTENQTKLITVQAERWLSLLKDEAEEQLSLLHAEYARTEEPVPYEEREKLKYLPIAVGEQWSERVFDCAWMHITGEGAEGEDLFVKLDYDGEGLVYGENGPVRGITNFSCMYDPALGKPEKLYIPLSEVTKGGKVDFWVDAASNDLFGNFHTGTLIACALVRRDREKVGLYYDFLFLKNLAEALGEKSPQRYAVLYALERAGLMLRRGMTREEVLSVRRTLSPLLHEGGSDRYLTFYAVGHSHLDLAWLWPIRESKRKAARTFSTALRNLEEYPFYVYGASQPQQFAWVKELYPTVYEGVKRAVKEGRFELQGATWVEADTNLPCGESLVRQFLYGQRFWREEFGKESTMLWIPDTFGYSGALPQIMRGFGVTRFVTTKLSWNTGNKFPHHTFYWQGIDGSRVLAHMPPEGSYNSPITPQAVMFSAENFEEKGRSDIAMLLFGVGDGGGGPGEAHLESFARIRDTAGIPNVLPARAETFFERLEKNCDLPVHCGEIYLERHQGTFTSQAHNKQFNRLAENALAAAEGAIAIANAPYDKPALDALWREVLLYQFHDIVPGSAIRRVYEETEARYPALIGSIEEMFRRAAGTLGNELCAFNPTPFDMEEYVLSDGQWYLAEAEAWAFGGLQPCGPVSPPSGLVLENGALRAEFSEDGALVSYFDKTLSKEMLRGESNLFRLYHDVYDAWDIYPRYALQEGERIRAHTVERFAEGPKQGLIFRYAFGASSLEVKISLGARSRRLTFEAVCDWQERDIMLRVEFSPDVTADYATYDVQFGTIRRSTLQNSSIEEAQYEVCGQKFADLSDMGGGFTVANAAKYGYRVKGNVISVDLLRSQNHPCKAQDIGRQTFTYAVFAHAGEVSASVLKEAYAVARPLQTVRAGRTHSPVRMSDPRILIETVKPAEDGRGIVVRAYNPLPERVEAQPAVQGKVTETDMAERTIPTQSAAFRPFEVRTYRIERI